ncbi:MAG TPA: sigma-70 family RNA polymerase sigma factor [Tepidisphaeraceae bacterium]|nr:sigma-70 family RNA polymerase sigma factor [Tepidisphaeraceae bacterium]
MKLSRDEFEKLALEQIDLLYRVARRLTHSEDGAGDLVQETFLRALRSYQTFDLQQHGIRPWLVRIMQNLHFSRSAREKRQPVATEQAPLEQGRREGTANPFAFQPAGWDGMDERLVRALMELPEDYRVVLLLWAVEEFSYKEIAESAEVPIGTVMSRLYRARQRLGEALHGFAVEEGVIRE